jgi:hypothetical protein
MNLVVVLGVVVVLVVAILFLKSHGGQTPDGGAAAQSAQQKATGILDGLLANPDFLTKWAPSLVIAGLLMFAWAKLPKLRYVIVGAGIIIFLLKMGLNI